ncbi:DMT family transporter [Salinispira pacifica]
MTGRNPERTTRAAVLVGVVFTSTSAILIRLSDAAPLAIAAYRMTFSALLMLPAMIWTIAPRRMPQSPPATADAAAGNRIHLRTSDLLWCMLSGLFLALHFASWITSLSYTTVASATVLVNTHPIFIVAASALFLNERPQPLSILLILAALGGSVLLALEPGAERGDSLLGNGLAAFGAAAVSGYLLIGRIVRPRLGLTQYTFIVYLSAALILDLACVVSGTPLFGLRPVNYLIFVGLALFPTLLGHSVFNWALRYLPPTFISIAVLGEPVIATLLALLLFREVPTLLTVAGGIVVIAAISGYLLREGRTASAATAPRAVD